MTCFQLISFEQTQAPVGVCASISLLGERSLNVSWTLNKNLDKNLSAPGERKGFLWEQSVFEFFLKPSEQACYFEIHLDPDLNWNVYRLSHYRSSLTETDMILLENPVISSQNDKTTISVTLRLKGNHSFEKDKWTVFSPVIWKEDGKKWHFATAHPKDKPDFHDSKLYQALRFKDKEIFS